VVTAGVVTINDHRRRWGIPPHDGSEAASSSASASSVKSAASRKTKEMMSSDLSRVLFKNACWCLLKSLVPLAENAEISRDS
jgi:hypothetical protein